ncbi:protein FAM149A [Conger conger]|uniref:protein FAM149A n=1 Tax=Conger conger TaxID=82655 RepID=UPI002A5A2E01|nr:protein FAM149A [Conger conger]
MSGALASLPYAPILPHLHQAYTSYCQARRACEHRGLIVIGKKLHKQNPGHGYAERSAGPVPGHVTTSVVGAIEHFHSISPDSGSSRSSDGRATPLSHPASWSGIQSCTTGLSTERSSICSWRDDEFDRVNTQRVCQLFSDVDELLYEGRQSGSAAALQEECREWNGHSPHLRILGSQLEAPKQEGFEYFHRRATCSQAALAPPPDSWSESRESSVICWAHLRGFSALGLLTLARCGMLLFWLRARGGRWQRERLRTDSGVERLKAIRLSVSRQQAGLCALILHLFSPTLRLCIEGQRVLPTPSSIRNVLSVRSLTSVLEEEVYEAEGRIEEFFAYDAKEADEERADPRKAAGAVRSAGVPPVSPHACIRDAVTGEVFDDVWKEVVLLLEGELLHKHWESEVTDGVTHVGTSELSKVGCDSSSHILLKTLSGPVSRGSDTRSLSLWPNIIPRQAPRVSSAFQSNLNGVMTIQAKPLQQRQHGFIEKPQCELEDRLGTLMSAGKGTGRLMEPNVLSASRGASAFSQKLPTQRRLPKLSAETRPSRGHGILRGSKLSTVTEGLATPPVNAVSKQRFPAIRSDTLEQELPHTSRHIPQQRGRFLQSRVGSALHPVSVSGLPPLREPTLLLESLTRPNTTHTFRSDTPIKRSFTPLEIAYHMRTGRGPMQGEPSRIGVTGFSLGVACSTANSLSECPGTQRRPANPSSTEEEEGEGPLPLGTFHQRKAFSRIPIHCKKKLQVALS